MPSFLGRGRRQFHVYDANRSRFITKLRWLVESVNTRLKWFSQTIENSSLPSVLNYVAIVTALTNCFHSPLVTPSPDDAETVRRINLLLTQSNILQDRLIQDNLQ